MKLRERLRQETVLTAWSGIPDPLVVELMAMQPFDAVTLDMQHGGHHEDSVLRSLPMVTGQGKHALVRIPVGRFDMASRAVDFGAEAVIAPMINSVEDARAFAASMKYPPMGERSWGPIFAMPRSNRREMAEWLGTANADTLAIAMVETRQALDVLDDILAIDGIDAIFVGPSDFSIAWSGGQTVDPLLEDMMEAVADIGRRTTAAGKLCATFITDMAMCGRYQAMGFSLLATGSEHRCMALGAAAVLGQARKSLRSAG